MRRHFENSVVLLVLRDVGLKLLQFLRVNADEVVQVILLQYCLLYCLLRRSIGLPALRRYVSDLLVQSLSLHLGLGYGLPHLHEGVD